MFRKSLLNITLSDHEDSKHSNVSTNNTLSFINISLSSLNESVDHLINTDDIIRPDVVVESKGRAGCIIYK